MKLKIFTKNESVVVCGEFCDWDIDRAICVTRKPKAKAIVVEDMPVGEYRVFSCKSFTAGEIYPTDGRQYANRYFSGQTDETIVCFFLETK